MFLTVNPVIGKGQFSIKDSDYGDQVLMQLATVLKRRASVRKHAPVGESPLSQDLSDPVRCR